eukprot:CAMPEP_0179448760 /NCGR_PEP_ID=MMETSP0799-20121207/32673_1 /TAXON_ID=46947 /ORGANISM="Geminigera cryophila, Strain CCMP2564" /LENGTH=74 /DNA_ID=CAMNT_0021241059 /DNA_START=73 /DNA_END=297 /DNA_ORIENTATION=+
MSSDDLPPLGLMEILPVVGMLLGILAAILYACGCLGGAAPSKKVAPGSGSKGFIKNPEGYDDEESEDDEDDKDK